MTVQLEKLRAELEQGREHAERDREAFGHELEKDLQKAEQERERFKLELQKAEQDHERFKLELPKIAAETRSLERETRYDPWLQSSPAALSPPLSPLSWRIGVDVIRRVFAH